MSSGEMDSLSKPREIKDLQQMEKDVHGNTGGVFFFFFSQGAPTPNEGGEGTGLGDWGEVLALS